MSHLRIVALFLLLATPSAFGQWSANLGIKNPFTSDLGVNFLHVWPRWAVEVGLGTISVDDQADDTSGINLGGGVNGKFMFKEGLFRPYVQAGLGLSSGVTGRGAGLGSDGILFGFGLFVWATEFYIYGSYNAVNGQGFFQMGIGFPLDSIFGGGKS